MVCTCCDGAQKDGSLRFCTDFRGLNAATITDAHPLPKVDDSIDKLAGSTIFSCLDLSSGYWQVELDSGDKEKTAFSLRKALWQYKVMAMGLKNALPTVSAPHGATPGRRGLATVFSLS